jgi:hypothetical protein
MQLRRSVLPRGTASYLGRRTGLDAPAQLALGKYLIIASAPVP